MDDLISRQAAIDDIRTMNPKDAQLDIKWVEMWLKQLPSAQPEQHIDDDGTLWITVIDIERVKRVIVDEEKSKFCRQFYMDAQPEQPKKTLYKHFKGGIYELIAPRAMNTEGNEIYTIYRSVKNGTVWVRPYDMFFGNVVNDKGEIVPRFVLCQSEGDAE